MANFMPVRPESIMRADFGYEKVPLTDESEIDFSFHIGSVGVGGKQAETW
jgi:hypothetical protein